jgi:hypothetical protein
MSKNYYSINMQKLLYIIRELHVRGFEKLRIVPSLSPSGLSWRCSFISDINQERDSIIASNWIQGVHPIQEKSKHSIGELTDLFAREHLDFVNTCRGENSEYVKWYSNILHDLKEGELPYAFADYFTPTDYW